MLGDKDEKRRNFGKLSKTATVGFSPAEENYSTARSARIVSFRRDSSVTAAVDRSRRQSSIAGESLKSVVSSSGKPPRKRSSVFGNFSFNSGDSAKHSRDEDSSRKSSTRISISQLSEWSARGSDAVDSPLQKILARSRNRSKAFESSESFRPKPLRWLLHYIATLHKAKLLDDLVLASQRSHSAPTAFPLFFLEHLKQQYGTPTLVENYATAIISSAELYAERDTRVKLFIAFATELVDTPCQVMILGVARALDESSIGPEYSNAGRLDVEPDTYEQVSIPRVFSVIDAMLADRPYCASLKDDLIEDAVPATIDEYNAGLLASGVTPDIVATAHYAWGLDEFVAHLKVPRALFLWKVALFESKGSAAAPDSTPPRKESEGDDDDDL